jgi:hypothetical protein
MSCLVESTLAIRGKGYVFVRILDKESFSFLLTGSVLLGGVPIENWVTQPKNQG